MSEKLSDTAAVIVFIRLVSLNYPQAIKLQTVSGPAQ